MPILLIAALILLLGEDVFLIVSLLLSLSLILFGVRKLIFFLTMARHMVDGRGVLYIGVIALYFGLLRECMRGLSLIYASGLIYATILQMISAFRKTAIVYIP